MVSGKMSKEAVDYLDEFTTTLEVLTFNSKPIIDELTKFAQTHKNTLAKSIAEAIEDRILEVRPDWKLPALYLLDSILKNVKDAYVHLFSKKIVHIFCHCFEKLVDSDPRKLLYKLRQTWTPYFPNRTLALIDRHIKALDPNWPVTSIQETAPVFVNRDFLAASAKAEQVGKSKEPEKIGKAPKKELKQKEDNNVSPTKDKEMSIQEKRRKVLEEKTSERIKKQEAMGILKVTTKNDKLPKIRTSPSKGKKGKSRTSSATPPPADSPLRVPSPRARSSSPLVTAELKPETSPPPTKRPKLNTPPKEATESKPGTSKDDKMEDSPALKPAHLLLDDLPPELLPKHHQLILKQIQGQLNSGNLTESQQKTLRGQLDKLYQLQALKDSEQSDNSISLETPFIVDTIGTHDHNNVVNHTVTDHFRPPVFRRPYPRRGRYYDQPPPPRRGPPDFYRHRMMGGPPMRGPRMPPQGPPRMRGPPPPRDSEPMDVSQLLNQLVQAGVIDDKASTSSSAVASLDFTLATLKQRHTAVIAELHNGEQCSTCGVRFPDLSGDDFTQHLDWHFNQKTSQKTTSRNWFLHPEDWLKFEELSQESSEAPKITGIEPSVDREESVVDNTSTRVESGESDEVCGVCGEALEQFWNEEQEEWHFTDTLRAKTGALYHTYCFGDLKDDDTSMESKETSPKHQKQ